MLLSIRLWWFSNRQIKKNLKNSNFWSRFWIKLYKTNVEQLLIRLTYQAREWKKTIRKLETTQMEHIHTQAFIWESWTQNRMKSSLHSSNSVCMQCSPFLSRLFNTFYLSYHNIKRRGTTDMALDLTWSICQWVRINENLLFAYEEKFCVDMWKYRFLTLQYSQ